jgi:hypothetical protein
MLTISIIKLVGSFAENKDIAQDIRKKMILPALLKHEQVSLDFEKVDGTTQSFVHALISDLLREFGSDVLDNVFFKNCNETVKKIINIVIEYMQQGV